MRVIDRWRWLIALLAIVALLGAACGEDEEEPTGAAGGEEAQEFEAGTTMAKLQEKGEIVIGIKFDVPLFGFKNPQSGEVEGFDVDLGNIIADELGVEPKFIEAISDNRIPFLQQGKADLILSTMTITTDRDAEIDFSRPYFVAHGRMLVPEDSDISEPKDLNGTKVCTALGSTYEPLVPEKAPQVDMKLVDSYSECFELLTRGQVDSVVTDDIILTGMIQQDPSLRLVGPDLTTDPYGGGVKEGDKEFADFVSGIIEDMFEDGRWQELYDKWIGKYVDEEPDPHPQELTLQDAYEIYPCDETC